MPKPPSCFQSSLRWVPCPTPLGHLKPLLPCWGVGLPGFHPTALFGIFGLDPLHWAWLLRLQPFSHFLELFIFLLMGSGPPDPVCLSQAIWHAQALGSWIQLLPRYGLSSPISAPLGLCWSFYPVLSTYTCLPGTLRTPHLPFSVTPSPLIRNCPLLPNYTHVPWASQWPALSFLALFLGILVTLRYLVPPGHQTHLVPAKQQTFSCPISTLLLRSNPAPRPLENPPVSAFIGVKLCKQLLLSSTTGSFNNTGNVISECYMGLLA